jgi:hypothetical protein
MPGPAVAELSAVASRVVSRRWFMSTLAKAAVGCAAKEATPTRGLEVIVSQELQQLVGERGGSIIRRMAEEYRLNYGFPHQVLRVSHEDLSDYKEQTAFGEVVSIEQSFPAQINLDANMILGKQPTTQHFQELRDTMLHALTHASKPLRPFLFDEEEMLSDGSTLYGYHGLGLLVRTVRGPTKFTKMEEGAAEALATKLHSDYRASGEHYVSGRTADTFDCQCLHER